MRDDEIRGRLTDVNPWWRAVRQGDPTAWAAGDVTLSNRSRYDLGYRPEVLDDIATGPVSDALVVVRGPRRVGKSVLLKDTILGLCGRGDIDPRQLVYLPTDGLVAKDLLRVAKLARDLTRSVDPATRLWFLDEVTAIRGWTETLKYLRDNTPFANDTVVCTGSSLAPGSDIERDLMAGRAGQTASRRQRILFPMRFRDILVATERQVPLLEHIAAWDLQGTDAAASTQAAQLHLDDLDLAWQAYLTSGGYPRAVAEHHHDGYVSDAFVADIGASLHRDVDPDAAQDSVALLLAEITRRCVAPLNRTETSQVLGYANRQAFDTRLNRLVATHSAIWCHRVNDAGTRVVGAHSKLYLTDPLLGHIGPRLRPGLAAPDFTHLTEAALAQVLARALEEADEGRWQADDLAGYYRTDSGNEIDFAPAPINTSAGSAETTPIESKWVTAGWRKEARVIEGKFHRGLLATRNVLDQSHDSWAVPAPIVALLLN